MSKAKRNRKVNKQTKQRYIWAYIFILPQILMFLGLSLYPIIMSYVYSFYDWSGVGPMNDFVGFDNYLKVFTEEMFWNAFKNTFVYTAGFVTISVTSGLILALILNNPKLKGRVVYRTLFFLPVVTTMAIVGIIMKNIFGNTGLINQVLQMIGVIDEALPWLINPVTAMIVLILVGSWKETGIIMIYWLTGLQMIPKELYEAAKIDGAGSMQVLRYITLPLLAPIGATILLLTTVSSMRVFDLVKTLTNGGPFYSTETLELYIYRFAFASEGQSQIGYASTVGVILGMTVFIISLLLGWVVLKLNKQKGKNDLKTEMKKI
ncbi:sugar ABC transporter permease [Bacillaceae bacterium SIJ1]|uniref:carbohydrate ABC transporter permease n=1 Tax=Litoribacterium kuwaitense TaxID=1398745 RepID=UPI0013EA3F52|nr:sugar ABC transporter permease [Litoribacterium kuwaitense]NGP45165.1 sugar ABC transporter permease [Litoribacterium kuwaitense]